ncbi:hydroxypyruvate reductase [Microvirga vignae]|uniref:Hydroxypyruvate reductase n=1 Tax=Microvirga vignae TaxID=1225564 RepID=A0A0H1R465_9HYPH|nr:glycerate kinase [Microvirga vignae]KLK90005.1 hydroxypyruvate reductase [Microvirga vignae]
MAEDVRILHSLFEAALAAALPDGKFTSKLPAPPGGRTIVVGAGKASARMAQAFEAAWPHPCEGLVVTRYGHAAPTQRIEIVEASHPVPDQAGVDAAERILELASGAGPDDLVVCLISGGASALLSLPAKGVTLADKQGVTQALLKSGAPIHEMNKVRKALSRIKGGRLALAAMPARVVTYVISDVPGDDPASIGSGPSIPEPQDANDAFSILDRYGVEVSPSLKDAILKNCQRTHEATASDVRVLATPMMALEAAALKAQEMGLNPLILGDAIEGEAREVAKAFAGIARSVSDHNVPAPKPCVLLSGGETTVTVRGNGRGGRNAEFLLALYLALSHLPNVAALACDTDGIDGVEDNAGAWFENGSPPSGASASEARSFLANNDAYGYFYKLDQLVVTGPTLTNVNDFRAILIR